MKDTRKVTYRRWGTPAIILEGKWLTKKLGWKIGDHVDVDIQPEAINIKKSINKNSPEGANGNPSTSIIAKAPGKSNHGKKPNNQQPAGDEG